jgi:hypothetical protein
MNLRKKNYWLISFLLLCAIPLLFGCKSKVPEDKIGEKICVVLAHPDDETIISGTLAMLSAYLSMLLIYV